MRPQIIHVFKSYAVTCMFCGSWLFKIRISKYEVGDGCHVITNILCERPEMYTGVTIIIIKKIYVKSAFLDLLSSRTLKMVYLKAKDVYQPK